MQTLTLTLRGVKKEENGLIARFRPHPPLILLCTFLSLQFWWVGIVCGFICLCLYLERHLSLRIYHCAQHVLVVSCSRKWELSPLISKTPHWGFLPFLLLSVIGSSHSVHVGAAKASEPQRAWWLWGDHILLYSQWSVWPMKEQASSLSFLLPPHLSKRSHSSESDLCSICGPA